MSGGPIIGGCKVLPPIPDGPGAGERQPAPARPARLGGAHRKATSGKATAGRFAILNEFVDSTMRDLLGTEAKVWFILYRDARDGIARTAQTDIARRAGGNPRTIRRAIKRLERRGLLEVMTRGGINRGPSVYRIRGHPPKG